MTRTTIEIEGRKFEVTTKDGVVVKVREHVVGMGWMGRNSDKATMKLVKAAL